jgi:hypothetical protein
VTTQEDLEADEPQPGVHAFSLSGDFWFALRLPNGEEEGDDVIIHDNQSGDPMASMSTTPEGIQLAYWDEDGEYRIAHVVPYVHLDEERPAAWPPANLPELKPFLAQNGHHTAPPMSPRDTEEVMPDPAAMLAALPALFTHPEPGARLRAYLYLDALQEEAVLPPGTWCVTETNPMRRDEHVWSAHLSREEAEAWCAAWREAHAEQLARHPHWSPSAVRTFAVSQRDGVHVTRLKRPGIDPTIHTHDIFR